LTAARTVQDVLDWAMMPDGSPPQGDLYDLSHLLRPDAALGNALTRLAGATAARLGLAPMASGNGAWLRPDALCLAAAVGGAGFQQEAAVELVRAVPTPSDYWQRIVHHGLVSPAIRSATLSSALAEELLMKSPLTSILFLPPKGGEDAAIGVCKELAGSAEGRRLLIRYFADPDANAGQLSWRGRLMATLRLEPDHRSVVLDIYEAAVALHGVGWRRRIRAAAATLGTPDPAGPDLNLALSVGRWWDPLRAIHAAQHQAIRDRNHLDFHTYLDGIRIAGAVNRLREGLR